MQAGDELLLQGGRDKLTELAAGTQVERLELLSATDAVREFELEERLWALRVTPDSLLVGRTLAETRLGDAVGLTVLAVRSGRNVDGGNADKREEEAVQLLPGPGQLLAAGDQLLVTARPEDMIVLRGLQRLEVDLTTPVDQALLEGSDAGFTEVVLAPRSSLVGRTLRQVNFRSRFGMHVVGIVREGEVIRTDLRDQVLRFGDALLLYGPRRTQRALAGEPDLILLRGPEDEGPEPRLAPLSLLIVGAALIHVILGWVPIAVGVLSGAALMVLTRCLSADEAYAAIEWPTLVLIAGMLALGAALDETGTVDFLGGILINGAGGLGPRLMLAILVILSALASQMIPATVIVVLMSPVALAAADFLQVSPYPLVMAVAISATALASPVSHPALALVMAPAGYRKGDYLRLGVPVTILVAALTIFVLPLIYPFHP
jgi:uncharacterized protein with PhoU and TrkA domain